MKTNHKIACRKKDIGTVHTPDIQNRKPERGAVLLLVLVVSTVALVLAAGLIALVTTGTQISGGHGRYVNVRDAGKGCGVVMMELVKSRGSGQPYTTFKTNVDTAGLNFQSTTAAVCSSGTNTAFSTKLMTASSTWSGCDTSLTIDPNDPLSYDMSAEIGTTQKYNCFAKIVSSTKGNSGVQSKLRTVGVVARQTQIQTLPVSYLYAIEVLAEQANNPTERARYSLLFQY